MTTVTVTKTISVGAAPSPPPVAALTGDFRYAPTTIIVGTEIAFDGMVNGGVPPYSFIWNFGDDVVNYSGQSVKHTYLVAGSYIVTLVITDSAPIVPVEPPPFNFAVDIVPNFGSVIQGNALTPRPIVTVTNTSRAAGKLITLTAPGAAFFGITVKQSKSTGVSAAGATFTSYASFITISTAPPGVTQINITGTDTSGLVRIAPFVLAVTATAPAFSVDFKYVPVNALINTHSTFTATPTGGTAPITYAWNFGDFSSGTGTTVAHAYTVAQQYTVNLTATDSTSKVATKSQTITIGPAPSPPGGRDPLLQPGAPYSIWNLPIGSAATYIAAGIKAPTQRGIFNDAAILVLKPSAPATDVVLNTDDWSGGSRCASQGGVQFTVPIPTSFVVPGAAPGNTPNNAFAGLKADGHGIIQGQPFTRCVAGQAPTIHYHDAPGVEDLYGTLFSGYHGGSHLSSIGGTIRLGELVPGGIIRHAMKIGLFGMENYSNTTNGFRWPATTADTGFAASYQGTTTQLKMGSLLALLPAFDVTTLETEPGKILAQAAKDYGFYCVDDAAWSVCNLITEISPDGSVKDEFLSKWGFAIDPPDKNNAWSRDIDKILLALKVVDNWTQARWVTVATSAGALGVGGGAPRVAWAPALGAIPAATVPTAPQSLVATAGNAQVSLSWQAPSSDGGAAITAYRVYRSTAAGAEVLLTILGNVLVYTDTGLVNGTTYYYKVSAVNGAGISALSAEASAAPTAANTVPTAPLSLTAVAGNTQNVLNWTTPASNGGAAITGYKVYRGLTAGSETLLTTLGVVLTYTNTALTNGQTYFYQVTATNSVGESAKSNEASATPAAPVAGASFDQIVVVAMENKNLNEVYLNSAAPYINGLGKVAFTHWRSVTNPSQPNYIAVIGGNTFGVSGDGNHPNLNQPTIVDIIERSGRTWKAIAEGASGTGAGINPPRGEDHFPFLSYTTIKNVPARAVNMIPGTTQTVIDQLNAGTNFIWFTPTDGHNMHDNSVSNGDSWLAGWLPGLLSAMTGKRCLVMLWWDEGYTNPPYMPCFVAGTAAKSAFVTANEYVHYSLLKLLEVKWGGGNLGQGDVSAGDPSEILA